MKKFKGKGKHKFISGRQVRAGTSKTGARNSTTYMPSIPAADTGLGMENKKGPYCFMTFSECREYEMT